ncbi:CotH kinase family protein [Marinimicrobium alkaliphilum]|uniref:CotH kinase family protein n=1 Tax=Marinimicrobium alkaliphilum TaxID=2202654 RepID=UPI001300478A|nr:CotH kinase family protein [Marinimicrobium alkaliphilum]
MESDDRLPAKVRLEDDPETYPVEMRFRGNSTRSEPKKGYNIRFDDGDQDFLDGADRINARAMWRDPSFVREHMAMWLFRQYELPAPDTFFFELFINDVFEGFYMHVERIDRRFSRKRGLNRDATLVRDEFRDQFRDGGNDCGVGANKFTAFADNNWSAMTREQALACVEARFNDRRADWDEVLDLILWVDQSEPGDRFAEELAERVDVEAMMKFLGVHILIGDIDTFWGNDYWWFKDHEDPEAKWFFIPWDKNLSMGSHTRNDSDGLGAFGQLMFPYEYRHQRFVQQGQHVNRLFSYFMQTDALRSQLNDWLLEQVDSDTWLSAFDAELERVLEQTEPYGRPRGLYDNEFARNHENHFDLGVAYEEHVEQVREYRDLRREHLRIYISGSQSVGRHERELTLNETLGEGETLTFVDQFGFTVGRFTAAESVPAGAYIRLAAVAGDPENPINKDWLLSSDVPLQGTLSVFYRNDDHGVGTAPGNDFNWYTGGAHSVGNQSRIRLESGTEGLTVSEPVARPSVNRLDVMIDYAMSGSAEARLTTILDAP